MKKLILSIITGILLVVAVVGAGWFLEGEHVWKDTTQNQRPEAEKDTNPSAQDTQQISVRFPEYTGNPYIEWNDNKPDFDTEFLTDKCFLRVSELDSLGRCQVAVACVGQESSPLEERVGNGNIRPSGWQTVKYDIIDGLYLYNRCHLIGYQLCGDLENEKNLITGTRYLNVEGMLPFENQIAEYIHRTNHHVIYRVTPIFQGENLVASGVLMEAESVEDEGKSLQFCVYCFNVQPGVDIDYATGESSLNGEPGTKTSEELTDENEPQKDRFIPPADTVTYVANSNSMKFHKPDCESVADISLRNRLDYEGSREELLELGYTPCKRCNP